MEDFTKNNNVKAKLTALSAPTKQPGWLTKNRFWNFVFWFGMSSGFAASSFAKVTLHNDTLSSAINWLTLLGIPLLVILANRTRFIKKDTFVNSENIVLIEKQLPTGLFLVSTILGVLFTSLVAETVFLKKQEDTLNSFILFSCLFSGISLYFIFKNCPISILFNRKFWKFEPTSYNKKTDDACYYSPMYKSYSSNIYHRKR